jgi:hypothetical protein
MQQRDNDLLCKLGRFRDTRITWRSSDRRPLKMMQLADMLLIFDGFRVLISLAVFRFTFESERRLIQ